jgi:hypothetical protein
MKKTLLVAILLVVCFTAGFGAGVCFQVWDSGNKGEVVKWDKPITSVPSGATIYSSDWESLIRQDYSRGLPMEKSKPIMSWEAEKYGFSNSFSGHKDK